MKICRKCNIEKEDNCFYKTSNINICKICNLEYSRDRKQKLKENKKCQICTKYLDINNSLLCQACLNKKKEDYCKRKNRLKIEKICNICHNKLKDNEKTRCINCIKITTDKTKYKRQQLRKFRKENKLCVQCGAEIKEVNILKCTECAEKTNIERKKYINKLKINRICISCHDKLEINNGIYCSQCSVQNNIKTKNRVKKLKENRLCVNCASPTDENDGVLCCKCNNKKRPGRTKRIQKRLKNDPKFKLRMNISCLIRQALLRIKSSKNNKSCIKYLPFTIDQLKKYIEKQFESWMTWENYGTYNAATWNDNDPNTWKWQIDHIIPQADLPYTSMEDENFKKCWSLENLRPLSAKQNLIDGVRRIRHKK